MQNIDVRFNATSNFGKVKADLAALQAQAAALSGVFQKGAYATTPAVVDPTKWRAATRAVNEASRVYRDAASSSGLMTTQQIRATSEAERYTKALQKQKLTMGEMLKHRGIMKQVYNDQLRYQRMTAQYWGTDTAGRAITDIAIPKNVPKDLDSMRRKIGFFGNAVASASTQMINLGKNIQWAGRQLTVGFTYPVALFGAAAGVMAFKVEDAFAKINKVYDVSAAALENEALRTKELGEMRVQSMEMATEVARRYGLTVAKTLEVEQALAATGLKGSELVASTMEVQRISALGGMDPSMTTDMVVALQTAFRKTIKDGGDLTNVLNFMNAASNATSLSLQDIAEATPRAASGLSQLGVTAEEMTIMLVSMREAGVDAAEGANALKSATTRILNPAIVKKASDAYKEFGANINVQNIVDKAGGNLFEFLKLLGQATRDQEQLTQQQKASAIAALFGTYQFNRLNAALVNIGDAYGGVNNQTSKAIELQQKSNAELAEQAKISEELMMNNPAGKFKKAWAEFQIELSKMGEPFLDIASKILEIGVAVGKWFNNMDELSKKILMWTVIAAAIAGPTIMLAGLFMNLFGHFIKGAGVVMKLVGVSKLLNKEEQAAILTAQAQNEAMKKQQVTTSTLAQEVQVLTAAYQKATAAARQYALSQGIAVQGSAAGVYGPHRPTLTGGYKLTNQETKYYAQRGALDTSGKPIYADASQAARLDAARTAMANDYMKSMNVVARDASVIEKKVAAETRMREKMRGSINGAAVATGAMSVAMAGMMFTSNETANNVFKWLIIGSLVVPAAKALAAWIGAAAKAGWGFAASQATAAAATARAAGGAGALRIATAGAWGGVKGMAAGFSAMMGPVGWIALGVTAVGTAMYAWRKHQEEIYRKQVDMQKALDDHADKWAESAGRAAGAYEKIRIASVEIAKNQGKGQGFEELVSAYTSGDYEGVTNSIEDIDDDDLRAIEIQRQFIDLQRIGGLTAKEASRRIAAMYVAMGDSLSDADQKAQILLESLGDFRNIDWARQVQNQAEVIEDSIDFSGGMNEDVFKAKAKNMAEFFNQGWKEAQTAEEARALWDTFSKAALSEFQYTFEKLSEDDLGKQLLAKYGIDSAQALSTAFRNELISIGDIDAIFKQPEVSGEWFDRLEYSKLIEDTLVKAAAGNAPGGLMLGDEINRLEEFANQLVIVGKLMPFEQQVAYAKSLVGEVKRFAEETKGSTGFMKTINDEMLKAMRTKALEKINQLLINGNLKEAKSLTQALNNLINGTTNEADNAADETERLKKALTGLPTRIDINIKMKQVGGIIQTAMGNVQSEMADSAMDSFNAGWDSRMDAVQASQEAAQNALEARQQKAMDAFDARWERRRKAIENAFQRRIDAINREIEAERKADAERQRLFEKEKERLQRLADMQNTNIDFNQALEEGRLDDAAKILNNAQAAAGNAQMDAEQRAAEARTETRIAALEKKAERLEKQRDKAIEHMEKMEARMRKHLERIQNARANALQVQQEQVMNSLEAQRDFEEEMLQDRLDLFQSYVARNRKDLEAWMREVGLSYDDFGKDVKAKGESWASHFRDRLAYHIRLAGTEVMNDTMWENVGKKIGEKLLKGLGFDSLQEFNHFVKTGERGGGGKGDDTETRHAGGIVGTGGGSRKGVPNTYKGLHRSEKMIRAQKGEYVINRKASAMNRPLLDAINSGKSGIMDGIMGGGGYGGPAALMASAVAHLFAKGVGNAFNNAYAVGLSKSAATSGKFAGDAGLYGGIKWSAEQMKNAATIASVGSGMGMSVRDLEIGIMTAITESMLRNLTGGDRDSAGLFQQRPSQGWGTFAQVTNPVYAATKFFSALKNIQNRADMTPWMAAQSVQRSAFSDGSNYARYWDVARAIFTKGLGKTSVGGFIPGGGGKHRPIVGPVTSGLHGGSTAGNPPALDFAGPVGRKVYAISDGVITSSRDIAGPLASDTYRGDGPYGSFGRMVQMRTDSGAHALYAHLSRRSVVAGQRVRGGSVLGYSGNTGNSSGPHLHFGATNGPYAWLRRGGKIRYDNTPVVAHKGETMLSERLTKRFEDNVAGGAGSQYNVTIDLRGAYIKEDVDIEKAVNRAIDSRENKVGRKRVIK